MSVLKPFVLLAAFAACTPVCAQQSREVVSEQASSLENSEQERTVENEENQSSQDESGIEVIDIIKRDTITESALDNRLEGDKEALDNVFAITQHRQNYLLPITYVSNPSSVASEELTGFDGVYFGFTLTSFWQLYNSEASKPFRETNYEPEVFWQETADYSVLGYKFNTFQVGFNHMSNGQSGLRSRSWNRIFASIVFSDDDDIYYLKTWYRIPEDEKTDPLDPTGDDNPDIQDYYGRMELGYGRKIGAFKVLALLRNNLDVDENRGSIQLDFTYPISDRYEVLLQYFNGYGDSLIDYNRSQERIGIGFQLHFL
ncbi:MAG: phospholipase A1 [Alteromonadales bacterium]